MKEIRQNVRSVREKEQPCAEQNSEHPFRLAEFRTNHHQTRHRPRHKRQKQVPVQEKEHFGIRIDKAEDGNRETEKGKNSHENRLIEAIVLFQCIQNHVTSIFVKSFGKSTQNSEQHSTNAINVFFFHFLRNCIYKTNNKINILLNFTAQLFDKQQDAK